jgi:antirestriction protein ArdC
MMTLPTNAVTGKPYKGSNVGTLIEAMEKATPEEEERTGRRFIPCGGWNVFNIEQTVELPVKVEEAA